MTFVLDDNGLVARASAPSRVFVDKGRTTAKPWNGRFWDYQPMGGRLIPLQGEVAWALDAGDFVYWRGRILKWERLTNGKQPTEHALTREDRRP